MANMTITKQNHVSIIIGMQVGIYTQKQKIVSTTKPNLRQNKKTKLHQTDLNKREILPGANIAAQKRKNKHFPKHIISFLSTCGKITRSKNYCRD